MNLFDLTGKVAIVTGSTRGIGRAAAEALAEHGAKVVISSRNQDACDEVAGAINVRFGEGTAIAVRKEDNLLREKFNAGIAAIRANGTYAKINAKHFPINIYGSD
jgi:NAD(P)-dependent dehydrogenase (short-subunit alcohol dehydrogenase family)